MINLFATLKITIDDSNEHVKNTSLGEIPLMVMSDKCMLFSNKKKLY